MTEKGHKDASVWLFSKKPHRSLIVALLNHSVVVILHFFNLKEPHRGLFVALLLRIRKQDQKEASLWLFSVNFLSNLSI